MRYQPGAGYVVARGDVVALLTPRAPESLVTELWQLAGGAVRHTAVLGAILRRGFEAVGDFGFAVTHEGRTTIVLRGDVGVVLDGEASGAFSGADTDTWFETSVPADGVLTLFGGESPSQAHPYPLEAGVVRAQSVTAHEEEAPSPGGSAAAPSAVATPVVAPVTAVPPAAPPPTAAPSAVVRVPPRPDAAPPVATPAPAPASAFAPAGPIAAAEPTPEPAVPSLSVPEPSSQPAPVPAPGPSARPAPSSSSFPQDVPSRASVRTRSTIPPIPPAPSGSTRTVRLPGTGPDAPAVPAPPAPGAAAPGAPATAAAPAVPAAASSAVTAIAAPVTAPTPIPVAPSAAVPVRPARELPDVLPPFRPNGEGDLADADDATLLATDLPAFLAAENPAAPAPFAAPVVQHHVRLVTGERVPLDRPILVGRAPHHAATGPGGPAPRLVVVPSPSGDISRTHARLEVSDGRVLVTDLDSTNGLQVRIDPYRPPMRPRPGVPTAIDAGAVVDLGDGVLLTIEVDA